MAGFDNDVMHADNVDFRGVEPVVATVTQEADLMIGTGADPAIKIGQLTSLDSSLTITYDEPNINLSVSNSPSTTKEFFVYNVNSGSQTAIYDPFLTDTMTGGIQTYFPFRVPFDFVTFVSAEIIIFGDDTGTLTYDLTAGIASTGEAYDADNRSSLGNTIAVTNKICADIDVSALISGIVANNNVCITIETQDLTFQAYGLRFRYNTA